MPALELGELATAPEASPNALKAVEERIRRPMNMLRTLAPGEIRDEGSRHRRNRYAQSC